MKTAANLCVAALTAMLGAGLCYSPALAQVSDNPIETSVPGPSAVPDIAEPSIAISEDSMEPEKTTVAAKAKALSSKTYPSAQKNGDVTDVVQGVISRLTSETQNVTLEDLNAAREAVVKLDVLIDIEKRLGDLDRLRQQRSGSSSVVGQIGAALPSGALSSAPSLSMPSSSMGQFSSPMLGGDNYSSGFSSGSGVSRSGLMTINVARVTGAAGSYTASITESSGKARLVREGTKLSDGSVVTSISSEGVTLSKGTEKETTQVKDVSRVFSKR